MRYSTTIVVAALTIGQTMAGPTHAHLHRHRDIHAKKDAAPVDWAALDWEDMGIDWTSAWKAGQHTSTVAPTPVPTTTDAPVIAVAKETSAPVVSSSTTPEASTSASSSNSVASEVASIVTTAFSSIKGLSDDLTSFGTATSSSGSVVGKIGNIGSPQGSNIIKVDSTEGYDFTNTFINTSGEPITIVVWNKAASQNGGAVEANLGSCIAPVSPALAITLAPGAKQIVAFQEDTQAGWAQATTNIAASGAYATTWGEVNYSSTGSGYDVSAIMNVDGNTYDMAITAAEVSCTSDMTQNMWIAQNNNPEDPVPVGNSDGSCYLPGSTATLTTKMGGTVS